jgi:plastocyanin
MSFRSLPLRLLLALAVLLGAATAQAGDLTVTITDTRGRPVPDAVVLVDAPGARVPAPGRFRVGQKDMTFTPFVLVVPAGSRVDFANLDPFRHHVYSFSPRNKFELKLFAEAEARSVVLRNTGTVAIGCNIHDQMQAFVRVVDTPYAARSGADGRTVLRGVPANARQLVVWHPHLRAPGNELRVAINPARDIAVPVKVRLRRPAPMNHAY